MTNSARTDNSSESGSVQRMNSQEFGSSEITLENHLAKPAVALEAALFSMEPREIM